jgi:hypothetical protein
MKRITVQQDSGISLVEAILVVLVIGILAALAMPSISNLRDVAKRTTAIQNAKSISQMSSALAGFGVAHVIPDSMGGVAATARLLREGVIVPDGPMAGEKFVLTGLNDEEIDYVASFLYVQYDKRELRLIFRDPHLEEGTWITPARERGMLAFSWCPTWLASRG